MPDYIAKIGDLYVSGHYIPDHARHGEAPWRACVFTWRNAATRRNWDAKGYGETRTAAIRDAIAELKRELAA